MELMIEHVQKRFSLQYLRQRANTLDFALCADPPRLLYTKIFNFIENYFPEHSSIYLTIWNLDEDEMIWDV
jgi:hypothetical protein